MISEEQQLNAAIDALQSQRALLGDAVVDASVAALRARLLAFGPPPGQAVQALRQVSILFLDMVGSTKLSQHFDPETISAVIDDALARGTAIVHSHGGKVLKYIGDSILAAFGTELAREDDAERAVQCGLALLDLGRVLSEEVLARYQHVGFNFRIGVHTGGVLLGGGIDAEASIHGSAVNIAARMEQLAPVGGLRITHDTYSHVRGLFEVQAQEPLHVKGIDEALQTYLVVRAKPRLFRIGTRGIEGVATRMIGRDAELERLQSAFLRLFKERRFAMVTVVAEPGLGKSRLLHEFEVWSEARRERFLLFRGRAVPTTGTQAFGLLRDIIAWRLQIADDDPLEIAREKMERFIVPLFERENGPDHAEAHAHLLGHLIGIEWRDSRHVRGILDDPKQIRHRACRAAAMMFRRMSEALGSPVVLQIDDLHWADDESLDFLRSLAEVNHDVALLMLSFSRPALFERRPDWDTQKPEAERIVLRPLGKRASRELASEMLQKLPEVPDALSELLIGSAEGNPFYMEELVRMLIDQGAIRTRLDNDNTWAVNAERLVLTKVPTTLTGVLQARLDGLQAPERRALQDASIVGAVFWDEGLAAVDAKSVEQLPALVRRELALPRVGEQLEGMREYAFRHQLLHQVTYDTVLKREKRAGHAKVAHWLAGLTAAGRLNASNLLGLAAEHFELAGDEPNAAEYHALAAEQAGQRSAHERVVAHVSRALALLTRTAAVSPRTSAELRWRLLSAREATLFLLARREEQATDQEEMDRLAEFLDDDWRRAHVGWRRALRAMRIADWSLQERSARHCMECATKAGDAALRLQGLRLLAVAQLYQGDANASRALAQQGLDEARRLGLRGIEARLLNTLGLAKTDLVANVSVFLQSLPIYREIGDHVNEAINLKNLGVNWLNVGDLARARRELSAAIPLLRANGDKVVEGAALSAISQVAWCQGDHERALEYARQALEIAQRAQARDKAILAGIRLGDATLALGSLDEAQEAYADALAAAIQIGSAWRHDASAGLMRVALAAGDTTAALAALAPLLDHLANGGTLEGSDEQRRVELACYLTLERAGDPRATDWLVRAHTALLAQAEVIANADNIDSIDIQGSTLRDCFLMNIPWHREIEAAWSRHLEASK